MSRKWMIAFAGLLVAGWVRATDVMFCFDAEDYTSESSCDVLRDLAKLMTEEQAPAQFNVVGYLARHLRQRGRLDVFSALKAHEVGSRTLYLAKRPTEAELTDIADAAQASRLAMAEESMTMGLIKTAFGTRDVLFYAPPEPYSYAAMYAVSDLGMIFCPGNWLNGVPGNRTSFFWYCGLCHLPVLDPKVFALESLLPPNPEPDYSAVLDRLAQREFAGLRIESSRIACRKSWIDVNFNPAKPAAFGEWRRNEPRSAADVNEFYARLRKLVRAILADPRFRLVSVSQLADALPPRRPITKRDIPELRHALSRQFGPLEDQGLSVADVFLACVELLRGGTEFEPGRVRGFLSRPEGVKEETVVSADELRKLAEKLPRDEFIPAKLSVGTRTIGPADFLFAALEVLETGARTVKVRPRDQLGDAGVVWPKAGTDRFLSERLRLQYWTLRFERP